MKQKILVLAYPGSGKTYLAENFDNLSDDELMEQMRELERQIAKRKKKQKDFEM